MSDTRINKGVSSKEFPVAVHFGSEAEILEYTAFAARSANLKASAEWIIDDHYGLDRRDRVEVIRVLSGGEVAPPRPSKMDALLKRLVAVIPR